jgi:hypothetical protein
MRELAYAFEEPVNWLSTFSRYSTAVSQSGIAPPYAFWDPFFDHHKALAIQSLPVDLINLIAAHDLAILLLSLGLSISTDVTGNVKEGGFYWTLVRNDLVYLNIARLMLIFSRHWRKLAPVKDSTNMIQTMGLPDELMSETWSDEDVFMSTDMHVDLGMQDLDEKENVHNPKKLVVASARQEC